MDEPKFINTIENYGAVTFNTKPLSAVVDPGQERLNQLGYKQVNVNFFGSVFFDEIIKKMTCCRNCKEDYQHLPRSV